MRWVVAVRGRAATVYFALTVLIVALLGPRLGNEISRRSMPVSLQLRLRAPAGTRVETTEKVALKVLDLIKDEAGGADKVDVTWGSWVYTHPIIPSTSSTCGTGDRMRPSCKRNSSRTANCAWSRSRNACVPVLPPSCRM